MSKIVTINDFHGKVCPEEIRKKYLYNSYAYNSNIQIIPPIFIEAYSRDCFEEIDFDSWLEELEKIRLAENNQRSNEEGELFTEQEVGKGTIMVPTAQKYESQERVQRDTNDIVQLQEEQVDGIYQ